MNYVYWLIVIPNARSVNHKSFTCVGGPRKTHAYIHKQTADPRVNVRNYYAILCMHLKIS